MEVRRTPDERFAGLTDYPYDPRHIELQDDLAGLRMHLVEEGRGSPTFLLLHGQPTWSFLYRRMIPSLAAQARVIAPDFIGFGRSDKPADVAWYSYERHVASIEQLIAALSLDDIVPVVQDWGGPIGLHVATRRPELFAGMVVLNTGLFRPGPGWPSPTWLAFRDYVRATPDLPIGDLVQAATVRNLSPEVIAGYDAPFPDVSFKAGPRSFPELVPTAADAPGADAMLQTRERLAQWDRPALVAFSDSDPIFPIRAGERMAARIPGARFEVVESASHFLQEDRGEDIADLVLDWWATAG